MSARLIEATYDQQLAGVAAALVGDASADATERELAERALHACEAVESALGPVEAGVLEDVAGVAPGARLVTTSSNRQNHTIVVRVEDVDDAEAAAAALEERGFERWERWTRGAHRSFRHAARRMTVARTDAETIVVRIDWGDRPSASPRRRLVQRLTTPTAGDWHAVDLPTWAWRGYVVVRPLRQLAERLGLRRRHDASLGPFLATPDSLLPPLFDLAGLGPDDVFIDLGCGDGRIAIAAAEQRGCRSIGVEQQADLVERAVARVADTEVGELVDIRHGDARSVDLADATCVFVFLPADVTARLLPRIFDQLRPGARVIAHEQSRPLPTAAAEPNQTELVIGEAAVTVARRWNV